MFAMVGFTAQWMHAFRHAVASDPIDFEHQFTTSYNTIIYPCNCARSRSYTYIRLTYSCKDCNCAKYNWNGRAGKEGYKMNEL